MNTQWINVTEMTSNFLNLLFEKGEEISVSANKYGYHSIQQDAINDAITLVSPNAEFGAMVIKESDINFITVNPIKGFRTDKNITAFRSFMVEIDTGTPEEQKKYIDESGLPYSACVFSGNKSLHYAIVMDQPFLSIAEWRFWNQWIMNVLPKIDQQNKNPARQLRFPGNRRKDGKKLIQAMVELKGRVSQEDLFRWLYAHEDKKPIQRRERLRDSFESTGFDENRIPSDVRVKIGTGISDNRNATWFYVGCRFAEAGFAIYDTISYLQKFYQEESSFKTVEWEGCIKSAYKRINGEEYVKEN